MSIDASTLVWKHSKATGAALVVMLRIADRANDQLECWPGVDSLAKDCRLKRRQALAILQKLKVAGEITWRRRYSKDPKHATSVYRITLDEVRQSAGAAECTSTPAHVHPDDVPTCTPASSRGARTRTQSISESSNEPSLNPPEEASEGEIVARFALADGTPIVVTRAYVNAWSRSSMDAVPVWQEYADSVAARRFRVPVSIGRAKQAISTMIRARSRNRRW